jgi:hypothetical protein
MTLFEGLYRMDVDEFKAKVEKKTPVEAQQ